MIIYSGKNKPKLLIIKTCYKIKEYYSDYRKTVKIVLHKKIMQQFILVPHGLPFYRQDRKSLCRYSCHRRGSNFLMNNGLNDNCSLIASSKTTILKQEH